MSEVDQLIDECLMALLSRLSRHGQRVPVEVPGWARRRRGDWNGRTLTMETRFSTGSGRLRRVHVARVTSDDPDAASSLTLIAVPEAHLDGPLLGAELIAFRGRLTLVGLDVVPTVTPLRAPYVDRLASIGAPLRRGGRERPRSAPFTDHAVLLTPAAEDVHRVRDVVDGFAAAFGSVLAEAPAAPSAKVIAAQRAWLEAMGDHMRELPALVKIFGADWTARYFDEAFFGTDWLSHEAGEAA